MQKNSLCYQTHQKWGGDNVMKASLSIQWSLHKHNTFHWAGTSLHLLLAAALSTLYILA